MNGQLRGFVVERKVSTHSNIYGFIHSQTIYSPRRRYFFHQSDCGAVPEFGDYVSFTPDSPNAPGQHTKAVHISVLISWRVLQEKRSAVLGASQEWNGTAEAEKILAHQQQTATA
jgi:hypothetical protein